MSEGLIPSGITETPLTLAYGQIGMYLYNQGRVEGRIANIYLKL